LKKSELETYVTVFTSYPHLCKNRLGKIGRLELRFLKIAPFWQQYYKELGLAVPLHQPGTNPSQLAQSEKLVYKGRLDD